VVSRDRPGNEHPDLWVLDLAYPESPDITQITDTPEFSENVADWSEDDSSFILMGTSGTYGSKGQHARVDWGAWDMPPDGSEAPIGLLEDAQHMAVWRR
jgi:hypothetical protein